MKKIYIAGKIAGLENYKQIFNEQEEVLKSKGFKVMNPAILPDGFSYEDYMRICFSMIDVCDAICFLPNWTQSNGAKREYSYAKAKGKARLFIIGGAINDSSDVCMCL